MVEHAALPKLDRFAHNQLTVLVEPLLDFKTTELIDNALRAFLESLEVGIAPPVGKISRRIELAALIVKAVGHLMADD